MLSKNELVEQFKTLSAGRESDVLIERMLFNSTVDCVNDIMCYFDETVSEWQEIPEYTTETLDALDLLLCYDSALRAFTSGKTYMPDDSAPYKMKTLYFCNVETLRLFGAQAYADTLALAICRTVLLAFATGELV